MVAPLTLLYTVMIWVFSSVIIALAARSMGKNAGHVGAFISGLMGAGVDMAFFRLAGAEIAFVTAAFVWAGSFAAIYGTELSKSMVIGAIVSALSTLVIAVIA